MSDTEGKANRKVMTPEQIETLRREVEVLELQARRKAALDTMRGDRSTRQQAREQRKALQGTRKGGRRGNGN